jgi:hypothetical protein
MIERNGSENLSLCINRGAREGLVGLTLCEYTIDKDPAQTGGILGWTLVYLNQLRHIQIYHPSPVFVFHSTYQLPRTTVTELVHLGGFSLPSGEAYFLFSQDDFLIAVHMMLAGNIQSIYQSQSQKRSHPTVIDSGLQAPNIRLTRKSLLQLRFLARLSIFHTGLP